MNDYYVYTYIRLDTGEPFYVGKGTGKRYLSKTNRNKYFLNIINTISHKVIFAFRFLSEKEAFDKEIALIKLYKNHGFCSANFTNGGEGVSGLIMSSQAKDKMRKAKLGRKNPHKGHIPNEETRLKMSSSRKGTIFSQESKDKISASKMGKKFSDEHRKKLSLAHTKKKPQ